MLFLSIISTAYHLLSGSGAARLLLNWLIDWLDDWLIDTLKWLYHYRTVSHLLWKLLGWHLARQLIQCRPQVRSFDWNYSPASAVRHSTGCRPWRLGNSGSFELVSGTVDQSVVLQRYGQLSALTILLTVGFGRTCPAGTTTCAVGLLRRLPPNWSAAYHRVPSWFTPILFVLYAADLISLIECHELLPHLYAYDTQVNGLCPLTTVDAFMLQVSRCADNIAVQPGWIPTRCS